MHPQWEKDWMCVGNLEMQWEMLLQGKGNGKQFDLMGNLEKSLRSKWVMGRWALGK